VFTAAFEPLMFHVEHHKCIDNLRQALEKNDVAAVLVEPMVQGAGGMIFWPADFLRQLRELCDRTGTLLIADEVFTGFGRTGKMFACEHAGISPDIICLSKGLTGGYLPLGVTAATEAIYEAFLSQDRTKTFFHGHSFTANPLACAVALASLRLFREEPVLERVLRLEQKMRDGLEPLRALPHVADVRVLGGIAVVELAGGGYMDGTGPKLAAQFLKRDILLRPLGNVVYFLPPYCITEDEAAWALGHLREVLGSTL
jgi:adenosylmethionine-8-amino-7-oxononanoate aminotransferase